MKIRCVSILAVVIIILSSAINTRGQDIPKAAGTERSLHILIDGAIGSQTTLGYKLPDTTFGIAFEKTLGKHFELWGDFYYDPTHKFLTSGHSFLEDTTIIYWINKRIGAAGGLSFSQFNGTAFSKVGWSPTAGVIINDMWMHKNPGQLSVLYLFPTGCTYATSSNPCTITDSRLQGVTLYQEFTILSHLRVGVQIGLYRSGDQVNPNAPNVPQSHEFSPTVAIKFRVPLFKENPGY